MTELPIRRVLSVALAYAVGGWVVLHFGGWLRRFLLLPPLFESLLRWGVMGGFFVALALAWSYPSLGTHGGAHPAPRDEESRQP